MVPDPSFVRAVSLDRLGAETFDVVVIGGGITGAGCALDAASRGLRTALLERDDFASGTSSKSSKMVHGGLRYLQQGEVRLVYEALAERQRLRRNAPHLVGLLPFLLPMFSKDGILHPALAKALGSALTTYDFTGGLRIGRRHKRITAEQALAHMPTLRRDRLVSSYLYYDAKADDARLTMTLARTAAERGAVVANHTPVTGFRHDQRGRITHVEIGDRLVATRAVINATGVWADAVRTLDTGVDPDQIRPAKGVHVTVPWEKVRNDVAVVVPVPKDRRSIFVVPWGDRTYIGTTDTDYDGPLDEPVCTPADVEYLLGAVNHSIDGHLTVDDVIGTWAGFRPLVKAGDGGGKGRTADLSRRHAVTTSPAGMVTVTGGKLTTYRAMAADAIDALRPLLDGRKVGRCRTVRLRLHGADRRLLDTDDHLAGRHGTDADAIRALIAADRTLGSPLVPGLPYLMAEAVWAVRHEMAFDLFDVLDRRTRARLLDGPATLAAAPAVASVIAPDLGWDERETADQVARYQSVVTAELAALTDTHRPGSPSAADATSDTQGTT